jgi:septal ring factor EnvC (AmiA/AmiB activator)
MKKWRDFLEKNKDISSPIELRLGKKLTNYKLQMLCDRYFKEQNYNRAKMFQYLVLRFKELKKEQKITKQSLNEFYENLDKLKQYLSDTHKSYQSQLNEKDRQIKRLYDENSRLSNLLRLLQKQGVN